jgi:hypothetical protein
MGSQVTFAGDDVSVFDNRLKYQSRSAEYELGRRQVSPSMLLVAGMLVVSLVGVFKGGESRRLMNHPAQTGAEMPPVETPAEKGLTVTMAAVLDAVAQRYRVSPQALQPIFLAAQQAANDIDPLLISAIIGIESGFNPMAQSVMGAQGLMQVIPRFHRDKLPPDAAAGGLLDPVSNVRVGTQVLKEAIRRQGGLIEGLQHYAGASDDLDRGYASRVIAEKQRLELAARNRRGQAPVLASATRSAPFIEPPPKAE